MKWVTSWSNAISIRTNEPEGYAKNITLRYPILSPFAGKKVRITLDNYTGKETTCFEKVTIGKTVKEKGIDLTTLKTITFNGSTSLSIEPTQKAVSDPVDFEIGENEYFSISIYVKDYLPMRAAVTTTGPLTNGYYATGDESESEMLPIDSSKKVSWVYYLSDIELYTSDENHAILCFGDSITAQSWPEYLQLLVMGKHTAILRKAVSGARVMHQYSCLEYESYGISGLNRFGHDIEVNGCDEVIILEGVNDMIHPVGEAVNIFRPMSDFPTPEQLEDGYRALIQMARDKGMKVDFATITPIDGWRTYQPFRNELRNTINDWIRTTDEIDGCIDFDKAIRNEEELSKLNAAYDSGDHLHPSDAGYQKMAKVAFEMLEAKKSV